MLSYNDIGDGGLSYLSESLKINSSLKKLNISDNHLTSNGLSYLSDALKINTGLDTLDISSLREINAEGMRYISESLKINKNLTEINISRNSRMDAKSIQYLSEFLKSNKSLRKIVLSSNKIKEEGMKFLSNSLILNSSLESIDLSINKIGSKGLKYLSDCLKINSSLKEIDISDNRCTEKEPIIYFLASLQKNSSVEKIFLTYFFDGSFPFIHVYKLLKNNNSIVNFKHSFSFNQEEKNLLEHLILCNQKSNFFGPNFKIYFSHFFLRIVFSFLCSFKVIEKLLPFKFGKFVLLEIVKKIDRKSFLKFEFPDLFFLLEENQHIGDEQIRKRKTLEITEEN